MNTNGIGALTLHGTVNVVQCDMSLSMHGSAPMHFQNHFFIQAMDQCG
jgi:hypothetical protein